MTDEPKQSEESNGDEWKMPEPVFRTSEGYRPGTPPLDPEQDIDTEPGFSGNETDEVLVASEADHSPDEAGTDPEEPAQSVRASTKVRVRHKKKSGCAKTFAVIVGTITLSVLAVIILLIYLAFYYRPVGNTF